MTAAETRDGRTAVLVLGMHRSGTSALAGVLAQMGFAAPLTQIAAGAQNPRGFFESQRVARLDDHLLETAGSSWRDWRPLSLPAPDSPEGAGFRDEAAKLIEEEFAGAEQIVLKDPRICRLVPVWSAALERQGYRPVLALIHRNPFEVAQSLRNRNAFPMAFGLLLWLRYVLDAERLTRGRPRAFTSYDRVLADWRAVVGVLGLALPPAAEEAGAAVDAFLSSGLRHAAADGDDAMHPFLSDCTGRCFEIMERWASGGEDERDHETLDRLGITLSEAGWAFADAGEVTDVKVQRLETVLDSAKVRAAKLERRLKEETDRRSLLERLLADAQGGLAEASVRNRELEEDRDRQIRELGTLTRLLREAEDQLHAVRRAHEEAEQRYGAVIQSSSWRITAPMRRVADRLRGNPTACAADDNPGAGGRMLAVFTTARRR